MPIDFSKKTTKTEREKQEAADLEKTAVTRAQMRKFWKALGKTDADFDKLLA